MTQHADVRRGRDIVARWCNLAEQRLDYLTELYETGRWRRYHGEREFLENIQEARAAVEVWRDLEVREATLDNTVLDLSWLGRPRWNLPRSDILPAPVHRLQPMAASTPAEPLAREVPADVLNALKGVLAASAEAPTAPDAPDLGDLPPASRDIDVVMQQRYPLLRNTL
jgi:uncharacterized repeat protein (TIGR03809 family)